MGREPVAQEWEMVIDSGLAARLIPQGQLRRLQRPDDVAMIPSGAYRALTDGVGWYCLEDLLLMPAVIRPIAPSRRHRCHYAPMCVLGIGERGLGLWVGAPASPDIQIALPFDSIAAIERCDDGPWRRLTFKGHDATFSVLYDTDGDASADIWTRRLRLRCAQQVSPLPEERGTAAGSKVARPFLIEPDDEASAARRRSLLGRGSFLLIETAREIIIANYTPGFAHLSHGHAHVLYVPRGAVTWAAIAPRTLMLHSADTDVRVPLPSRGLTEAASRWFLGHSTTASSCRKDN